MLWKNWNLCTVNGNVNVVAAVKKKHSSSSENYPWEKNTIQHFHFWTYTPKSSKQTLTDMCNPCSQEHYSQ